MLPADTHSSMSVAGIRPTAPATILANEGRAGSTMHRAFGLVWSVPHLEAAWRALLSAFLPNWLQLPLVFSLPSYLVVRLRLNMVLFQSFASISRIAME